METPGEEGGGNGGDEGGGGQGGGTVCFVIDGHVAGWIPAPLPPPITTDSSVASSLLRSVTTKWLQRLRRRRRRDPAERFTVGLPVARPVRLPLFPARQRCSSALHGKYAGGWVVGGGGCCFEKRLSKKKKWQLGEGERRTSPAQPTFTSRAAVACWRGRFFFQPARQLQTTLARVGFSSIWRWSRRANSN